MTALHEGAQAFRALMAAIGRLSEEGADPDSGDDLRDYVAMVAEVRESLKAHVADADHTHAEGYLRALTDLLCIVGDGCGPGQNWDPLANTEAAFAAPAAIRRAAQAV